MYRVEHVADDGDVLTLRNGQRVRLVQIDMAQPLGFAGHHAAPETSYKQGLVGDADP